MAMNLLNAFRKAREEIKRIVEEEDDWLLATIPDRELPSLKLLMLEHEIWKKEMVQKKKNENQNDSQIFCEVKK